MMNRRDLFRSAAAGGALSAAGCGGGKKEASATRMIEKFPFGKTADGKPVDQFKLSNSKGVEVSITNYGGIVTSIRTPDKPGKVADIALGFSTLEGYLGAHPYFGALIGRYGNRIAKGEFKLGGQTYRLAKNNNGNSLHGGNRGFDKVVWTVKDVKNEPPEQSLTLAYRSVDGEEGYPGNLDVTVRYSLNEANELKIEYSAITDKPTVANLTNHTYFNLAGEGEGDILGHLLMVNADRYTPVDAGLIPTGELAPVEGTPFDFRSPTAIGARIEEDHPQLKAGGGYDHNYVLNRKGEGLSLAAKVTEPGSGRTLEVQTTEPGVQFYCGNFLDGTLVGKSGRAYPKRSGFCLETQHYPDSPNQPKFPSTVLEPGKESKSVTVYRFSVSG
jgi:aldose 1-epimerase